MYYYIIMIKYIKDTITTLFENFLLTLFLYLILIYLEWPVTFPSLFVFLYFLLLFFLVLLKRLLLKWRRFYILHFTIKKIDKMSGIEFENYLKICFENLGFKVRTTKTSGDYGADLILQKKNYYIAVQAKRYHGNIGVKAVQEVIGSMAYYNVQKGLVVTNSHYTKNAENLAYANDVILWDRDVLLCLIARENMAPYLAELLDITNY